MVNFELKNKIKRIINMLKMGKELKYIYNFKIYFNY